MALIPWEGICHARNVSVHWDCGLRKNARKVGGELVWLENSGLFAQPIVTLGGIEEGVTYHALYQLSYVWKWEAITGSSWTFSPPLLCVTVSMSKKLSWKVTWNREELSECSTLNQN
jgi:hypothetical protein